MLVEYLTYYGRDHNEFWKLTFREFSLYREAAAQKVKDRKIDDLTRAWYTANYSGAASVGKLPRLEKIIDDYIRATERSSIASSDPNSTQSENELMTMIANFSDTLPQRRADEPSVFSNPESEMPSE